MPGVLLEDVLRLPQGAKGLVIFAHGSGSSRYSVRNHYVARALNEYNLGTLLIDLLTHNKEQLDLQTRHLCFDIPMLSDRQAASWFNKYLR